MSDFSLSLYPVCLACPLLILLHGCDRGDELCTAARQGDTQEVRSLLSSGCSPNAQGSHSDGPLYYSASRGHVEIGKLLLASGAKVNVRGPLHGRTPLWIACANKHVTMAQVLLDHGADANARSASGRSPLMCAVIARSPELVELLLQKGADVRARDSGGSSALHYAAGFRQDGIVKALIEAGAELNAVDKDGNSPLHRALDQGDVSLDDEVSQHVQATVKLLVGHGADVSMRNRLGETPVSLGKRSGLRHIAGQLEESGPRAQ